MSEHLTRVIKDDSITISEKKPFVLYGIADTHLGPPKAKVALLRTHIERIKKEKAYWVHLGDWCDFIDPKDKRYNADERPLTVQEQKDLAEELFAPIADTNLAVLKGNHGATIFSNRGDWVESFARRTTMPYLGVVGRLELTLREKLYGSLINEWKYLIFMHHGKGMGYFKGGKLHNLERFKRWCVADLYLMGHVHTYITTNDINVGRDGDVIRHYAVLPGYLPSVQYVRNLGLEPSTQGMVKFEVFPVTIEGKRVLRLRQELIDY